MTKESETHICCWSDALQGEQHRCNLCCQCGNRMPGTSPAKIPTTNPSTTDWEKEFDAFSERHGILGYPPMFTYSQAVKSLIRTLLSRKEEEVRKDIIRIVDTSRTTDEVHGVGRLENHARWQAIADILAQKYKQ